MSAIELPDARTICQSAPPAGSSSASKWARGVAAGERNDPPVALRGVTEVDGCVQLGVEPVDVAQLGVGEGVHRGSFRRSRVSGLRPTKHRVGATGGGPGTETRLAPTRWGAGDDGRPVASSKLMPPT